MSTGFNEISADQISDNTFKLFGADWTAITAGRAEKFNSMTASWGSLGVLWNRPIATIFVRPQRYTREFLEQETHFSLCFFPEAQRNALRIFGAASGRELDKAQAAGLTPVSDPSGCVYYAEARLVLILKKIYHQDLDPANIGVDLADTYADQDYHRMYIGEIVKVLRKD